MNPQAEIAKALVERSVADKGVAGILTRHGYDPEVLDLDDIAKALAALPTREMLAISSEIHEHSARTPQVQQDAAILATLAELTYREWQKRVAPIRDMADTAMKTEVAAARRAIQERDDAVLKERLTRMRDKVQEIGDNIRAAQNAVRQEVRGFLDGMGFGAGEERNMLVERNTRSLIVPDSIQNYMAAPAMLEAEQVRAAQRDQQNENERAARPQASPSPHPF